MTFKEILVANVIALQELAQARNTVQGAMVYEAVLKKIYDAKNDAELVVIHKRLKTALTGMEAYGYFTQEEYKIIDEIKGM